MRNPSRGGQRAARRRGRAAATGSCWVCGLPLDPVLLRSQYASHPCCDPAEISPLWPPGRRREP